VKGLYEAVAETTDGTYRAYLFNKSEICILEDAIPGIADRIDISDLDGHFKSAEGLVQTLIYWLHEYRRGIEVLEARLTLGND
jgi:hypothetical protein